MLESRTLPSRGGMGTSMRILLVAALFAAGFGTGASAQTVAEDEARIEELIRREQALKRHREPAAAPAEATTADADDGAMPEATIGAPVADAPSAPSFATPATPAAPEPAPQAAIEPGYEVDPAFAPIEAPVEVDPNVIAIADLAAHVGRAVRVRSHGGRQRVGVIESVERDAVTLKVAMGGGYARFSLPYSQITRIERL